MPYKTDTVASLRDKPVSWVQDKVIEGDSGENQ